MIKGGWCYINENENFDSDPLYIAFEKKICAECDCSVNSTLKGAFGVDDGAGLVIMGLDILEDINNTICEFAGFGDCEAGRFCENRGINAVKMCYNCKKKGVDFSNIQGRGQQFCGCGKMLCFTCVKRSLCQMCKKCICKVGECKAAYVCLECTYGNIICRKCEPDIKEQKCSNCDSVNCGNCDCTSHSWVGKQVMYCTQCE